MFSEFNIVLIIMPFMTIITFLNHRFVGRNSIVLTKITHNLEETKIIILIVDFPSQSNPLTRIKLKNKFI